MNYIYICSLQRLISSLWNTSHGQLRSTALRVHRSSQSQLLFHVEHNFARNLGKNSSV